MNKGTKIKILDFIINNDIYGRKAGSKVIRENFGNEGYKYYQDLWKMGCLKVNEWNLVKPTRRKGSLLERELKGWSWPKPRQNSGVKTQ